MTSANFQPATLKQFKSSLEPGSGQSSLPELVLTQDGLGHVFSFEWQLAERYGIQPAQVIGSLDRSRFHPTDSPAYFACLRRVLETLTPEQASFSFGWDDRQFRFDLVISPVLVPHAPSTLVVVVGQLVADSALDPLDSIVATPVALAPNSDRYQKLLTEISWNIRRTLDLQTIWQQTVQGLGKALSVSRCLLCPYDSLATHVSVVAEYCQDPFVCLSGSEFWVAGEPDLNQAIATLKPVTVQASGVAPASGAAQTLASDSLDRPSDAYESMLVVATCYQDQPNGLLILHQCDRRRLWSAAEIEFVRELADQVGTAIAHATLFAASQSLASELQRVNSSLLQKHRELEEARQQAEEASRLKSDFLANTSHELRTPLNGMLGFLKLIMDGMADDPEEQAEFINEAYRSALHLLNIINDVLDIAKIEAGKLQIELSPVKLDEILDDVTDFTRSQAHQKQLSFEVQKPPTDDEILLYGNYQRLLQVMLNLVGNAIKFTHEGGITIGVEVLKKKVSVQNQELPGLVKVRVADTGIGVSLDKQDKLFQSFSQVDGSRTRQYGGTGLGLAISQKLVEAMGGEVNFYSLGDGLGSTVTFTVPLFQEPLMIESTDPASALRLSESLFGVS